MIKRSQKLLPSKHDAGSAALDFVLVSVPMLMVSLGIVAIFLNAFTMSVIRDSAVEGSRFAALADQSTASGCIRSETLLAKVFGKSVVRDVSCQSAQLAGIDYEVVRIQISLPILGVFRLSNGLFAESKAPRENQQ